MSANASQTESAQFETARRADVCGAAGCRRTGDIKIVTNSDGRTRALCPQCRKDFLGVSS